MLVTCSLALIVTGLWLCWPRKWHWCCTSVYHSDYCLHLHCYIHNISADASLAFFRCFLSNLGAYMEPRSKPFMDTWSNGYRCLLKVLLSEIIWRLQVQSWLSVNNKKYLQQHNVVMVSRIGTIYRRSTKKFDSMFCVVSRVQLGVPKDSRRTNQPKRCEYNDEVEDNCPDSLNDKICQASFQNLNK